MVMEVDLMAPPLSAISEGRLKGVHPDLIRVVHVALARCEIPFTVLEGVRSEARQKELLLHGATTTMKSRHLTGHAVDLGPVVSGMVRWDWPLFYKIAAAMKSAATELGIEIEWGGDWKTFKDGPHFQLPWAKYPISDKTA
jgi:peptidoglycan L-alanyl-D-glutamate endopeptidase CwlK